MTVSEELLMAYVDGELTADQVAMVERAMAADPALAERVHQGRTLRQRLQQAYAPVLAEPLPERLLAAARGATPARVSVEPSRSTTRARGAWGLPQWAAMAASLLLGVLLAPLLTTDDARLVATVDGRLEARGTLAQSLDRQLASEPATGAVAMGVSFRAGDGRYCRTFAVASRSLAGLACREGERWRLPVLGETPSSPGEIRQASSALPPSVLAEVDARLAEPLDAAAERRARAAGWR